MYVPVLVLIAAAVLGLGRAASSAEPECGFDRLPDEILAVILAGLSVTDLGHLSLTCRRLLPLGRHQVVPALFESPLIPDYKICELARIVAVQVRYDRETVALVQELRPQQVLVLYQSIMLSKLKDKEKAALLRCMIRRLGLTLMNDVAVFLDRACFCSHLLPGLPVLDVPVPRQELPESVLDVVEKFIKPRLSWLQRGPMSRFYLRQEAAKARRIENPHLNDLRNIIRPLYPSLFCHALGYSIWVATALLRSFPRESHPLSEAKNVLALRHYGIVLPFDRYLEHVEIPPESVADIAPLLHFDIPEVLARLCQLVKAHGTGPAQALEWLKVPFIQRRIFLKPKLFIRSACDMLESRNTEFFESLSKLPFMPRVIDRSCSCDGKHTLLDKSFSLQLYDIVKILMQIPNASLFLKNHLNASLFDYFLRHTLRYNWVAGTIEFVKCPEFMKLMLSNIPALKRSLLSHIDPEYVRSFRALVEHPIYWNIPEYVRSELIQYSSDHDSDIYEILSSAEQPLITDST